MIKKVRGGSETSCRQLGTPLSSMGASEEPNDARLSGCSRLSLIVALNFIGKSFAVIFFSRIWSLQNEFNIQTLISYLKKSCRVTIHSQEKWIKHSIPFSSSESCSVVQQRSLAFKQNQAKSMAFIRNRRII
jgi:hypothetical protein